jgi:thiamine-monophosphate kinase
VSEDDRIKRLTSILAAPSPAVSVGIGDDAAVIDRDLVWTIDEQVEGIHFRRELLSLEDLGWRSLMSAASDIAAMGADPLAVLASLVLPKSISDDDLDDIARGQAEAARAIGAPVAGGNLSRGGALSIATTVIGRAEKPVLRSGARAGDRVLVSGPLGLAHAGLRALERNLDLPDAISAWRRPIARLDAGRAMRDHASAAIDISDGLSTDVGRLARASSVRITLRSDALTRVTQGLDAAAASLGADSLDLILQGGEDYALVCTSGESIVGFHEIGVVEQGEGVWLLKGSHLDPVLPRGWDHFM